MNSDKLLQYAVEVFNDRKAENISIFNVKETSILTDYILICCGNSVVHIRALLNHVDKRLKELGILPKYVEGAPASKWIIADYSDVIIHIFDKESREFYNLDDILKDSLELPKSA